MRKKGYPEKLGSEPADNLIILSSKNTKIGEIKGRWSYKMLQSQEKILLTNRELLGSVTLPVFAQINRRIEFFDYLGYQSQHDKQKVINIFLNMTNPGPKAYQSLVTTEIHIHELQTIQLQKGYKFDSNLNAVITDKIQRKMKQSIIAAKNDLNLFFERQLRTIVDYLYLKCRMYGFFKELMGWRQQIQEQCQQDPILKDLDGISFMGFIILISKLFKDKKVFGFLLHQQAIPLPIFFKVGNHFVYQPALCDMIIGSKQYQLVLNVGSVGAKSKGKSLLITKIMNKNEESQIANEFEDSFYLHTQPLLQASLDNENKQIMLMDFNGSVSPQNPPQVKSMLKKFAFNSALIMIHLTKVELLQEILKTNDFLQLFGQNKPKVILFFKDGKIKAKLTQIQLNTAEYKNVVPFQLFSSIVAYNFPSYQEDIQHTQWMNLNSLYENVVPQIKNIIYKPTDTQIPKLSLKSLNMENKEKIRLIERIQQAVKPLQDNNFKRKNEAKYLCSIQLICQKMLESKTNKNTSIRIRLNEEIAAEKAKINTLTQSSFIKQSIQLISGGDIGKPLYTQLLNKAKKAFINQKKNTKAGIEPSKTQELEKLQRQIAEYDINTDDVVNQFVGSQCYSSKLSEGAKKAQDYYRKCFEEMSPLNIIDSNTLLFGNSNLQEFFKSVDIKFKDIFVVSVFGSQSSGKSTLLNHLFRSNFETSLGRCTKGVNISFCKIDQTLIVVLDTEGIMSTVARNDDFTLRIPTFAMMASDLIILTNQGQIQDPFLKLMKDCLTIFHNIRKSQQQYNTATNSIKDQCAKENIHKMLIALKGLSTKQAGYNIIQDEFKTFLIKLGKLEKTQQIKYSDYIDLTSKDIFSLPNHFESKKSPKTQIKSIQLPTDDYGKAILSMRSSIKEIIDNSKQKNKATHLKSLKSVYQYLNVQWRLLYEADNLQSYKQNYLKKQEQQVQKACKEKTDQIKAKIKQNYCQISKNTQSKVDQDTFVSYIDKNEEKSRDDFKSFIRESVPSFIQERVIEKSVQKFDQIYMYFVEEEIRKFKKNKFLQEDGQKLQKFVALYENVLQICRSNQNKGRFQKSISESLKNFDAQTIPSEPSPDQQKFKVDYMRLFNERIIRQKGRLFGDASVNQCKKIFTKIKEDQENIKELIELVDPIKKAQLEDFYPKFIDIFKRQLADFERQLQYLLKAHSFEQEVDIMYKFRYINNEIEKTVRKLAIKVLESIKQAAVVNKQRIRLFLLGKVYEQTQKNFLAAKEKEIIERNLKIQREINDKKKLLNAKVEQTRKNANKQLSQTLKSQSISFFDTLTSNQKVLVLVSKKMEQYFEILKVLYRPDKILAKALNLTLLCPQQIATNSRVFFIECYKIVKNPKKFIQQLLMNQSFYILRKRQIDQIIEKVIQSQKQMLLQKIKRFQNIEDDETFKLALQDYNMTSTYSKFENFEGKSAKQLANQVFEILRKEVPLKIETISNFLRKEKEGITQLNKKWQERFNQLQKKAGGCDRRCPMCGMKCILQEKHSAQSHETLDGCHSLTAFGGCSLRATNEITTMLCQSDPTKKKIWKLDKKQHKNYHQLVTISPNSWENDFPYFATQSKNKKMALNLKQLKIIWANIEQVMLRTKFQGLSSTPDIEVTNADRTNQLNKYDLQEKVPIPQSQRGETTKLRHY